MMIKDSNRIARGGSWSYYDDYCEVSYRGYFNPSYRSHYVGFRMCIGGDV